MSAIVLYSLDQAVRHGIRLLSYVEGPLMSDVSHSEALLKDVGAFMATVGNSLDKYDMGVSAWGDHD